MATKTSSKSSVKSSGTNLLKPKKGINMWVLIAIAAVVIGGGIFIKFASHASVATLSAHGCNLRDRAWSGSSCTNTCIHAASGPLVTAATYNYCKYTESAISSSTCSSLGRVWLTDGCARRYDQKTTASAPQCSVPGATYIVASPYDKCSSSASAGSIACNSYFTMDHDTNYTWYNISSLSSFEIFNNASSSKTIKGIYRIYYPTSSTPVYTTTQSATIPAHSSAGWGLGSTALNIPGISAYNYQGGSKIKTTLTVGSSTITCGNYF